MMELEVAWLQAKNKEDDAKRERLSIEEKILEQIEKAETGTIPFGNLRVSFGYTEKWDDDGLRGLSEKVKPEYFPFKTTYKCDKKKLDVLKDIQPALHDKLSEYLTLIPRKPAFKVYGEKNAD